VNKFIIIFVLLGTTGAGLGVGAPFYAGVMAESSLNNLVDSINQSGTYQASLSDYQKGIYSTDAILKLKLNPETVTQGH